MTEYIYKIRDLETGKYSLGGSTPSWGKEGKIWKRSSDVMSHFNLIVEIDYENHYKNAVVECHKVEKVSEISAKHYFEDAQLKKELKEKEREKSRENRLLKQRWELYKELKNEFEQ